VLYTTASWQQQQQQQGCGKRQRGVMTCDELAALNNASTVCGDRLNVFA